MPVSPQRPQRMPSLQLPGIEEYCEAHTSPEPEALIAVAAATQRESPDARMMVGQLEGGFLRFLVHMLQPKHVLEIGTFTGYSAIAMAGALPPGGRITTLDIDPVHAAIAQRHFVQAGVADRVTLRLGAALATLASLPGPFDLVFIDADKGNYPRYFEAVLPKLSPNGVIAVDNVLWRGEVLERGAGGDTRVIQAFNAAIVADPRVECVMLPLRDGLTLIRRRG
ncbi:MAG: O-methyltransferase [Dehalococcoidia bacterium]